MFGGETVTVVSLKKYWEHWSERAAEHLKGKLPEVKDLLELLAQTAESQAERDQRYVAQLHHFLTHLLATADLEDVATLRSSLLETVHELKCYVDQMQQHNRKALAHLESRVTTYENRLKQTEELLMRDLLTGLPNRLRLERWLEWKVQNEQPFSVAILKLNQLKAVNEKYGHPAGDQLLKQFAGELKSNVRPGDVVGRWGGEEFMILPDCDYAGTMVLLDRMRKWAFGDYIISIDRGVEQVRVCVSAEVGTAEWMPDESMQQPIERAHRAMYQEETQSNQTAGQPAGLTVVEA